MHILFLILKIIGWILLVVLGLVVLTACLVLFTPLRYQVRAKCDGDVSSLAAEANFSVFFHLIRASVRYMDRKLSWQLALAWKKFSSEPGEAKGANDHAKPKEAGQEPRRELGREPEREPKHELEHASDCAQSAALVPETRAELPPPKEPGESGQKESKQEETKRRESRQRKPKQKEPKQKESKQKESGQKGSGQKGSGQKEPLSAKLSGLAEKLKCTFQEVCGKIETLQKKKDILVDFITDDTHVGALKKVLYETKKLFRRLLPKKFQADVHFGFEDPSVTGRVLAGISMVYPAICEHANIQPDFQQEVLEGSVFVKGRVRACIFAAMFCNLLLNANCRRTLLDAKNFSLNV